MKTYKPDKGEYDWYNAMPWQKHRRVIRECTVIDYGIKPTEAKKKFQGVKRRARELARKYNYDILREYDSIESTEYSYAGSPGLPRNTDEWLKFGWYPLRYSYVIIDKKNHDGEYVLD
jgi:hypothetical protein